MLIDSIDTLIPVNSDISLSARMWFQETVGAKGRTTILEVTPYRLSDFSSARDRYNHEAFARAGFTSIKVDMRGTGNALGTARSMLSEQEVDDTLAVIDWIVAQDWSDGSIVLFGISWGAIHAMMVAARRPAALKAVVALSYYTNAFGDGLMYKGGCITTEMAGWSGAVLGYHTRAADPARLSENWISNWDMRARAAVPDAIPILAKPFRSRFWRERTVDPASVSCPVLSICGALDSNFASSVYDYACAKNTALIMGPWAHRWPDAPAPGPGLDILPLIKDWLSHYVNGADEVQPPIQVGESWIWVQENRPAAPYWSRSRGFWLRRNEPLTDFHTPRIFYLGQGSLACSPQRATDLTVRYAGIAGWAAGEIMPAFNAGPEAELAAEQSADDSKSLHFDSDPLRAPLMLCGRPRLEITLQCTAPTAQICARLCEVRPNGESVRISYGLLNLCLIDATNPAELKPGATYRANIALDFLSYRVAAGCRIRLSLSNSYWPLIWPSRDSGELQLSAPNCRLELPIVEVATNHFDPADYVLVTPVVLTGRAELRPPHRKRTMSREPYAGAAELAIEDDNGRYELLDNRMTVESHMWERHSILERSPANASSEISWKWRFERDNWRATNQVRFKMESTGETFIVKYSIRRWNNETEIASVSGCETFPRRFH